MIDHSQCDHPRTSSARAKCRRGGGSTPRKKASEKEVDFSKGSGGAQAQTPGWKSDECHVCGVERMEFQGTDSFTGLFVLVGERCAWRIKRSEDFAAMAGR